MRHLRKGCGAGVTSSLPGAGTSSGGPGLLLRLPPEPEGRHPPPQPAGRGDGRHAPRYQRDDCRVHGGAEGRGRSDDIIVRLRDLRLESVKITEASSAGQ